MHETSFTVPMVPVLGARSWPPLWYASVETHVQLSALGISAEHRLPLSALDVELRPEPDQRRRVHRRRRHPDKHHCGHQRHQADPTSLRHADTSITRPDPVVRGRPSMLRVDEGP
jgi:hypothetical protein